MTVLSFPDTRLEYLILCCYAVFSGHDPPCIPTRTVPECREDADTVRRGGGRKGRVQRAADSVRGPHGGGANPTVEGGDRNHELRLGRGGNCVRAGGVCGFASADGEGPIMQKKEATHHEVVEKR